MPDRPPRTTENGYAGPVVAGVVPRYAGPATFARLPRMDEVSDVDVAVGGVPFDGGVSYRPGARFGPAHVRESSRLPRPCNPALDVSPFGRRQVADAGDVAVSPFSIEEAVRQVEADRRAAVRDGPAPSRPVTGTGAPMNGVPPRRNLGSIRQINGESS